MTLTVAVKRWWRSQLNSARRVGKEQRVHRYSDICSTQTEPEFISRTCKVNKDKRKDLTSQTLILYPLNFPFSLKMLCYSDPNPPISLSCTWSWSSWSGSWNRSIDRTLGGRWNLSTERFNSVELKVLKVVKESLTVQAMKGVEMTEKILRLWDTIKRYSF